MGDNSIKSTYTYTDDGRDDIELENVTLGKRCHVYVSPQMFIDPKWSLDKQNEYGLWDTVHAPAQKYNPLL